MNKTYEIKIFDSCEHLPANAWKKESIRDFEKTFAVKWYAIFTYDGETIIGSLRVLRNPDDISNWYICDVFTMAEYRHMGIATKMYEAAFDLIREYEAASCITVSISATNVPSLYLHKKLGFCDTAKASQFANFCFEADETIYSLWLTSRYPARNVPIHLDILRPMWIQYRNELGKCESEDILISELQDRINLSENNEHIFFDIIWSGNDAIGFVFYSVDGDTQKQVSSEGDYIKDLYLLEQWRKHGIGSKAIQDICENLKANGR